MKGNTQVLEGPELTVTPPTEARSGLMKKVRQKGTSAEEGVRQVLRELGFRYRLNVSNLPGSPDIAHKDRRKAIFVNGCFWHYHSGCRLDL